MKLEDLTNQETELLQSMPKNGFFKERDEYLEKNGIYKRWRDIFEGYVHLASAGDIEAVKRALFFLWYQCSEPNALSGINNLDDNLVEKALLIVNSIAENEDLDMELKWMLPYYYAVTNWYFERFKGLNSLLKASKRNENLWETEKSKSIFGNRGQLGEYWSSIQA